MTKDDIIRMARAAGFDPHDMSDDFTCNLENMEHFAALVAAAEREACIKAIKDVDDYQSPAYPVCIEVIRARGLQDMNKQAEKNGEEL
jgi:hypothetical protein